MRSRTLALCSTSIAILALAASPGWAQDGAQPVQDQPNEAGEEGIVVTGFRESLRSAQNIKRNADQIVDAIVAEDIGKLPDITASAALARVTGVQVNRSAGEAAQVQIRGLPDISTTYNGREIFTAENRFVAIQDFPAGAVAALEVYKSSTANLIEGGIGGQVNVRSRRPFDFDGFHLSGQANGVLFEQSQQVDWNGNLLVSNRWDTGIGEIGALVNFALTNIDFLDSTRENDRFLGTGPGGFRHPNGVGLFYGSGNRWRPSVNAAIQWRPNPDLQFYVDGLFQGYRGEDSNFWHFVPLFDNSNFSNVVLFPGTDQAQSLTADSPNAPDGFAEFRDTTTDTYQIAGGAIYERDSLRLSFDAAYTDSTFTDRQANVDYAFASSPIRDVNFDIDQSPGGAVFDYRDFNTADPNNYLFRGLFDRVFEATGDDIQARADLEWETGIANVPIFYAGLRFNDRDAGRRNAQRYMPQLHRGLLLSEIPVDIAPFARGFRFDSHQPETVFIAPTFDSVFGNLGALREFVGFPADDPVFEDFDRFTANEKAYSAYAQIKYEFDPGFPVDGLIGLRAVRTETEVSGTSRTFSDNAPPVFTPVTERNEYTDWLPNASLRAELADGLQLRLAYTQTRTRPNFDQLNPSSTFDPLPGICATEVDNVNCIQRVNGGNPNLLPLESTNYDVSLEYYFSPTGSLTGALFRRDTSNFITRETVTQVLPNAPDIVTNLPINTGEGRLQGVELAFTSFLDFDWVPEWARGFGAQANYTYIDAETGGERVPFVSKHAYNLVGLYESEGFTARLAYNWRSEFVLEYNDFQGFRSPTVQNSLGQLDFSTTVTPWENVTFAFDVLNLLGTPIRDYRAYSDAGDAYPWRRKYLERVYSLGVRFRL